MFGSVKVATGCALLIALGLGSASASVLTTTYQSNNGQSGNIFNITATHAITITGFEGNFSQSPVSGFEIWYRPGGAGSPPFSTTGWTELASLGSFTAQPTDTATPIPATLALSIGAGQTVGLYLTTTGSGVNYTNGTAVGDVAAQNADLTIYQGYGVCYPLGCHFNPRIWNGTIEYTTVPEPATLALFAVGLLGLGFAVRRRQKAMNA